MKFRENGIIYDVELAEIGFDVDLKPAKLGSSANYKCIHCGSQQAFDIGDVKIALLEQGALDKVQRYQKVAEDLEDQQSPKDFLGYLIRHAKFRIEHKGDYKNIRPNAAAQMRIRCMQCMRETIFNLSAEAEMKAVLSHEWLEPTGEPLSWESGKATLGEFFEIYENDNPSTMERLDFAKELIELSDSKPLPFKNHDDLVRTIRWDSDTLSDSNKKPFDAAAEFLQKINEMKSDVDAVPKVVEQLKTAYEKNSNSLKTRTAYYTVQKLSGALSSDFQDKTLRSIRRLLAENLLWLSEQVNALAAEGRLK